MKRLTITLAVALALTALVTPAQAAPETLAWQSCSSVAPDWTDFTAGDTETECATVTVPMDYARPDGRTLQIAVSRLRATGPARRGVVLLNPGGPGGHGIDFPLTVAKSQLAELRADRDLIGFDPRGIGYSDRVVCDVRDYSPPVPASEQQKTMALAVYESEFNTRCAAIDPAFTRQLTTANVARDMDVIRRALGVDKIGYYGESWGTALGANYRSLFDKHVDRMWLDSVMPPVMDVEAMDDSVDAVHEKAFAGFAKWLAERDNDFHFGTTRAAVTTTLVALRQQLAAHPRVIDSEAVLDGATVARLLASAAENWPSAAQDLAALANGGVPADTTEPVSRARFGFDDGFEFFNFLQNRAVICNDGVGGRDPDVVWRHRAHRMREYPATGGLSSTAGQCPAWPLPARRWELSRGRSPLQLSGHRDEDVTPYAWAEDMRDTIGGSLLMVPDAQHASLKTLPCAAKVVAFFRTGRETDEACP